MRKFTLLFIAAVFYGCAVGFVADRASIEDKSHSSIHVSAGVIASENHSINTAGVAYSYRRPINPHVELSFESPFDAVFDSASYTWFLWPTVSGKFSFSGEGLHAAMKMGMGMLAIGEKENSSTLVYPMPRFSVMLGLGNPEKFTIGFTAPPFYFWGAYRMGRFSLFGTFTFATFSFLDSSYPVVGLSGGVSLDF